MAHEKSDLIILTKEHFEEYLKKDTKSEMQTANLNKLLSFLEKVPIFAMFSKELLVQICTKCTIQQFPS
jgi:cAMP-dependent protein kinase regulator